MQYRCQDAPRDGRWVLIHYDHNDDAEYWHVARWRPKRCRIGNQRITYEWQYIDWNGKADQLSDGRVCDWRQLPK